LRLDVRSRHATVAVRPHRTFDRMPNGGQKVSALNGITAVHPFCKKSTFI
jgi:hypothetical protein